MIQATLRGVRCQFDGIGPRTPPNNLGRRLVQRHIMKHRKQKRIPHGPLLGDIRELLERAYLTSQFHHSINTSPPVRSGSKLLVSRAVARHFTRASAEAVRRKKQHRGTWRTMWMGGSGLRTDKQPAFHPCNVAFE